MEKMCGALKQLGTEIDVTNLPDLDSCEISSDQAGPDEDAEKIET